MTQKTALAPLPAFCLVLSMLAGCSPAATGTPTPLNTLPAETATDRTTTTHTVEAIPAEAISWLVENAVPFDTAEPGHGCEDLQPFLEMVEGARLVALGEATHGTHEFFAMKHRLVECLVSEKGFTLFAMEAGWAEAEHINAWVQGGEGENPAGRLGYFMAPGEVVGMIEWMRGYNETAAETVGFHGFDPQFGDLMMEDLLNYIAAVDPGSESRARQDLECFRTHVKNWSVDPGVDRYSEAGEEIWALCQQGLSDLASLFAENREEWELVRSPLEYAQAARLVRLLQQNEELMRAATVAESINVRDRAMAENIAWLLEQAGPERRMVIWAHNGHISPAGQEWENETGEEAITGMGVHLEEMFGEDYLAAGFSFATGSFRAYGATSAGGGLGAYGVYRIDSPLPGSLEELLAGAGLPRFYLDLRALRDTAIAWFHEPHCMMSFGMGFVTDDPEANAARVVPGDEFDLLFFFEETSASQP